MNELYAIGIPTLNRADLLNQALDNYAKDFPNTFIIIVDNGDQKIYAHPNMILIRPEKNIGVAASWNELAKMAFTIKIPNIVLLNDDVISGKKEKDIADFIAANADKDLITTTGDWCIFILPEKTFLKVGDFDETFFPAYYEDNDYAYRMKLLDMNITHDSYLSPFIFRKSMTIQKNWDLNKDYDKNKNYYIEKWGGEPGKEIFKTPFDK